MNNNIDVKAMREEYKKIPEDTKAKLIRNLACAICLEAAKDYVGEVSSTTRESLPAYFFHKPTIIKDLKDSRMVGLSDGMSLTVAHMLQSNAEQVKNNLQTLVEDYDIVKVDVHEAAAYR